MADLERMKAAVEKAYDDEVSKLFDVMCEGLVEAAGPNPLPGSSASQATFRFSKGMKIAGDARDRGLAVAEEMAK